MTRRSLTAYALVIGMPSLRGSNARLFYARAVFYERLFGSLIHNKWEAQSITLEDVQRFAQPVRAFVVPGVKYEPTADWTARMFQLFRKKKVQ